MITQSIIDFRDCFPEGGRLAGLDVGTKTIGVAVCDAMWTIASPAELIERRKFTVDLAKLRQFVEAQSIRGVVVGLPLNMDGTDSPRTQSVRAFVRNLDPLGLPIFPVGRTLVHRSPSPAPCWKPTPAAPAVPNWSTRWPPPTSCRVRSTH